VTTIVMTEQIRRSTGSGCSTFGIPVLYCWPCFSHPKPESKNQNTQTEGG